MRLNEYVVIATVTVVLLKVLVAGISFTIGTTAFTTSGLDGGTIAALLAPVLASLHARDYINKRGSKDDVT